MTKVLCHISKQRHFELSFNALTLRVANSIIPSDIPEKTRESARQMYNYDNYYQVKPVFKFPPFIFKGEPCVELTFVAV
jgi:hypothetical protein